MDRMENYFMLRTGLARGVCDINSILYSIFALLLHTNCNIVKYHQQTNADKYISNG